MNLKRKVSKNKLININHFSLTNDLNQSERIDDEQYGIEPGMVLSYEKSYGLFKKIKTLNPIKIMVTDYRRAWLSIENYDWFSC